MRIGIIGAGHVGGLWRARGPREAMTSRSGSATRATPRCRRATIGQLARDLGFDPVDCGLLTQARLLEPEALLWISLALVHGPGPDIGFGLLPK